MKEVSLYLMSAIYTLAGILHFVKPRMYLKIMPPYMPAPLFLVYFSGVAEIAGGLGLLIEPLRAAAAWGIIALLIAVFPANVYMYQKGGAAFRIPQWVVVCRLPLQLVLIAWAYWHTK